MLFPFLPFMVQFLLPDIDASSIGELLLNLLYSDTYIYHTIGKYAGMVASAMFLGRFIGR